MDSTISAAGSLVEGALTARALEPAAGETPDGHFHESACLNCGTALVGRHCHQCGQAAHVHRTLGALFHDLLHGMIHFEGKVWRTIPLLAWRPGQLTREYIDGRRASYVSPVALFLFCVFLTFAAVHFAHGSNSLFNVKPKAEAEAELTPAQRAAAIAKAEKALADARTALAKAPAGDPRDAAEERIEDIEDSLKDLRAPGAPKDGTPGDKDDIHFTGKGEVGQTIAKRMEEAWRKSKANPELTALKMEENAHKYSWLLVPLSVPFVWLMFAFSRRFRLYDHTVFVTYSLCFMMLLQSAAVLAGSYGLNWLVAVLVVYVPIHMYRHLRGTYGTGRYSTVARTLWLLNSAAFALLLWVITLMALLLAE